MKREKEIYPSDNGCLYLDFACIREFMMVLRRNAEICRPPHTHSGKRWFVVFEPGSIDLLIKLLIVAIFFFLNKELKVQDYFLQSDNIWFGRKGAKLVKIASISYIFLFL